MKPIRRLVLVAIVALATSNPTAPAHATEPHESVRSVLDEAIPNVPGKKLIALEVEYPPGAKSPSHHHEESAFIMAYVLSGEIRSQIDDGPVRVYRAGETWYEVPGAHHRVSENASATHPAKLLAVFVVDSEHAPLTTPDRP